MQHLARRLLQAAELLMAEPIVHVVAPSIRNYFIEELREQAALEQDKGIKTDPSKLAQQFAEQYNNGAWRGVSVDKAFDLFLESL